MSRSSSRRAPSRSSIWRRSVASRRPSSRSSRVKAWYPASPSGSSSARTTATAASSRTWRRAKSSRRRAALRRSCQVGSFERKRRSSSANAPADGGRSAGTGASARITISRSRGGTERGERGGGRIVAGFPRRVRRRAGEEEVERAAEAVHVRGLGGREAIAPLLRRHVRDRADGRRARRGARRERGRDPEVGEHHPPRLRGDEDVLGLEVAVDDRRSGARPAPRARGPRRGAPPPPRRAPARSSCSERPIRIEPGLASSGSAHTAIST